MDNQDKIFEHFKKAAANQESADFDAREKVWSRLEDKLDHKVLKKENTLWKKIAIAASILLVVTVGYEFFKPEQQLIIPQNEVAVDSAKAKEIEIEQPIVTNNISNPIIKKEATQILKQQIEKPQAVAIQESERKEMAPSQEKREVEEDLFLNIKKDQVQSARSTRFQKGKAFEAVGVRRNYDTMYSNPVGSDKKSETQIIGNSQAPLVVIDGKAITGKAAEQINSVAEGAAKVNQNDDREVVILKEPLYIINGHYYSEEELFGPNPTSPYAPLNQQEIETILVLEGEKAIVNYGKKGEKGVVVITTKDRKPAKASPKKAE
jgi:hypothetical protein